MQRSVLTSITMAMSIGCAPGPPPSAQQQQAIAPSTLAAPKEATTATTERPSANTTASTPDGELVIGRVEPLREPPRRP